MAANSSSDTESEQDARAWQRHVLDSGMFDETSHPKDGYSLNDSVVGRDGIIYGVVGIKPGEVILSDGEKERVVDMDFVRPGADITNELISRGLVGGDKERIYMRPAPESEGVNYKRN